ncbi:hypothetical protein [Vibrio owensii]|uniref:hypothetical protein n=1 Tax=Vibrio owensii TaxID=696485 RepID=UPI0018F2235F|nr:hypothetical protein [Vibrio owensii]
MLKQLLSANITIDLDNDEITSILVAAVKAQYPKVNLKQIQFAPDGNGGIKCAVQGKVKTADLTRIQEPEQPKPFEPISLDELAQELSPEPKKDKAVDVETLETLPLDLG